MNIINEAKEVFGNMRDATAEEQESIDKYLKKISTPTGVNFFEIVKEERDAKMSGDLISRKASLKQFTVSDDGRRIPEYDIDNFPITVSIKDVKDIIRKAPVAFDREKVIKALQLEKENAEANYRRESNKDDYDESYADYWLGKVAAYEVAIDIVKKGGI